MLETLALDVTGWPAVAVEFFELLQTTQYLNHRRLFNTMPDLRDTNVLNLLDTPFDSLPHTADMRHIYNGRGKHNIRNIGIFLWRLQNYPLKHVTPRQASAPHSYGYLFSPVRDSAALFKAPGEPGSPQEQLVPGPIRLLDFYLDLDSYQKTYATDPLPPSDSRYYGPRRSLLITRDGLDIPPMQVVSRDLSTWEQPTSGTVAVDVLLGRLAFASGQEPRQSVTVCFNYGFSADIGGGPYDRRARMTNIALPLVEFPIGAGQTYTSLAAALQGWSNAGNPPAVIRIYDSATYDAAVSIDLPKGGSLVIDCENEERPTLVSSTPIKISSAATNPTETAALSLSGLLIEGGLELKGKLNLAITDCTLVPGLSLDEDGYPESPDQPSLQLDPADVVDTSISITRCLTGPLELPEETRALIVQDSIIDAPSGQGSGGTGPGGHRRGGAPTQHRPGHHA